MNDLYYNARVRALELALQLSGSHKYKMAKAEEFYQFLALGADLSGYVGNPYTSYGFTPTVPFTLTANQTITNG